MISYSHSYLDTCSLHIPFTWCNLSYIGLVFVLLSEYPSESSYLDIILSNNWHLQLDPRKAAIVQYQASLEGEKY